MGYGCLIYEKLITCALSAEILSCKRSIWQLWLKIVDKIDFLDIISVKINRGEPIEEIVKGFDFL
jgi:hypothetical protein